MAIHAYTGRPGTGKTYAAVQDVVKNHLNIGHVVYSNIQINWNGHLEKKWFSDDIYHPESNLKYWSSIDEINKIEGNKHNKIIVFIDEIQMYMNSRKWKSLSEDLEWKLQQHRKFGIDFIVTTQALGRVDVVFRELVHYWYECRNIANLVIMVDEYDIDHDPNREDSLRSWFHILNKKGFNMYDSYEPVKSSNY